MKKFLQNIIIYIDKQIIISKNNNKNMKEDKFNKEDSKNYLINLAKKISFEGRILFLSRENETQKDFVNYIKAIKELVNSKKINFNEHS